MAASVTKSALVQHCGLKTSFRVVQDDRFGPSVNHFRGIPYAQVPSRFANPVPLPSWNAQFFDATQFGSVAFSTVLLLLHTYCNNT